MMQSNISEALNKLCHKRRGGIESQTEKLIADRIRKKTEDDQCERRKQPCYFVATWQSDSPLSSSQMHDGNHECRNGRTATLSKPIRLRFIALTRRICAQRGCSMWRLIRYDAFQFICFNSIKGEAAVVRHCLTEAVAALLLALLIISQHWNSSFLQPMLKHLYWPSKAKQRVHLQTIVAVINYGNLNLRVNKDQGTEMGK